MLVLPFWWDKPFWEIIVALPEIFEVVERFAAGADLFTSPNAKAGGRKYCGPTRWPVVLVRMAPTVPAVDWQRVWAVCPPV